MEIVSYRRLPHVCETCPGRDTCFVAATEEDAPSLNWWNLRERHKAAQMPEGKTVEMHCERSQTTGENPVHHILCRTKGIDGVKYDKTCAGFVLHEIPEPKMIIWQSEP